MAGNRARLLADWGLNVILPAEVTSFGVIGPDLYRSIRTNRAPYKASPDTTIRSPTPRQRTDDRVVKSAG